MNKKTIERLEHRLCTELDEISEKDHMSMGDLDMVDKGTRTLASIQKIRKSEGGQGYSQDGGWAAQGTYGRGYGYADGMTEPRTDDGSYAMRRRRTVNQGYSQTDGPDEMRETLREMIDKGQLTQQQRQAANTFMDALMR